MSFCYIEMQAFFDLLCFLALFTWRFHDSSIEFGKGSDHLEIGRSLPYRFIVGGLFSIIEFVFLDTCF